MPDEDETDAPDPLVCPVWEDTPDETDADLLCRFGFAIAVWP